MSARFTLTVPLALTVSSNRAAQTWKRQKVKNWMHEHTRIAARDLPPMGRATMFVGIHKRTAGLYDPVNLSDSFKGCADALVAMGVLDQDDYRHLIGPWLYHAGIDKRIPAGHLRAVVTLTDYSEIPF